MDDSTRQGKPSCDTRLHTVGLVIGWLSAVINILHCFYFNGVLLNVDNNSRYICKVMHLECVSSAEFGNVALAIKVIIAINLYSNLTSMMASILVINVNAFKSPLVLVPWIVANLLLVNLNIFSCYLLFSMDGIEARIMAIVVAINLGISCFMIGGIALLYRSFIHFGRRQKEVA